MQVRAFERYILLREIPNIMRKQYLQSPFNVYIFFITNMCIVRNGSYANDLGLTWNLL